MKWLVLLSYLLLVGCAVMHGRHIFFALTAVTLAFLFEGLYSPAPIEIWLPLSETQRVPLGVFLIAACLGRLVDAATTWAMRDKTDSEDFWADDKHTYPFPSAKRLAFEAMAQIGFICAFFGILAAAYPGTVTFCRLGALAVVIASVSRILYVWVTAILGGVLKPYVTSLIAPPFMPYIGDSSAFGYSDRYSYQISHARYEQERVAFGLAAFLSLGASIPLSVAIVGTLVDNQALFLLLSVLAVGLPIYAAWRAKIDAKRREAAEAEAERVANEAVASMKSKLRDIPLPFLRSLLKDAPLQDEAVRSAILEELQRRTRKK